MEESEDQGNLDWRWLPGVIGIDARRQKEPKGVGSDASDFTGN